MQTTNKLSGVALATTAAAFFALSGCASTGSSASPADTGTTTASAQGHCQGVNACKGLSSCKSADHACKGQNSCKGQGFVALDEQTCDQVGGTFEG